MLGPVDTLSRPVSRQETAILLPRRAVSRVFAAMPSADLLSKHDNPARAGLVRHGGIGAPVNHVPAAYKHSYREHLLHVVAQPAGNRAYLVIGSRNSFQNLMLPIWVGGHLVCRFDEPWAATLYTAFCRMASGELAIQQIQFESHSGEAHIVTPLAGDVDFAVVGQPILFRGGVLPTALLHAMTYDQRHLWHLLWEDWQQQKFPGFGSHRQAHDQLMQAFMETLSLPLVDRAAALSAIAARHALQEEDGYLHSSLGLTADGSIVLLMKNGSLRDHALEQRQLGAESAVLLDNGGSVGAAYWSALDVDALVSRSPRMVGAGTYFRDAALTTLVVELSEGVVEEPFAPR
jgi:hypothetical protein